MIANEVAVLAPRENDDLVVVLRTVLVHEVEPDARVDDCDGVQDEANAFSACLEFVALEVAHVVSDRLQAKHAHDDQIDKRGHLQVRHNGH